MKYRVLELILHGVFWLCTAWLLINGFSVVMHDVQIVNKVKTVHIIRNHQLMFQTLTSVILGVVLFYLSAWVMLMQHQHLKKTGIKIVLLLLTALLLGYLLNILFHKADAPPLPKTITLGIIVFYFSVSIAYSVGKLLYRKHQHQQQILMDKKQTEITLLRNQLQPHFLFNALNNLLSMVNTSQQPKLADSFHKLSQLLRYVIEEIKSDKVSLKQEISFLENYIALQKLRFHDAEIEVHFQVAGPYLLQLVEPGLFITFVENAFKYGTEPEQLSQITIQFDIRKPDQIHFEIRNPIRLLAKQGSKTGLESIRRRLALIYPEKHKLDITQHEQYIVSLTIETI